MHKHAFDVVIIGAGLVGQAIAVALAQGDEALRVALIDPAFSPAAPADDRSVSGSAQRVAALTPQSQASRARLRAWQRMPAERLSAYTGMHVWDAEGTGSVTFAAAALQVPALGHIVENN